MQQRALALFELGGEKYREGDFSGAVELLTEAYELHPEPVILYNLARAYEGMGETVQARDTYSRYLDSGAEIEDRGAIEGRVASLTRQIEEREALERERAALEAARRGNEGDEEEEEGPPRDVSLPPWLVAAGGVVMAGVGVALVPVAQSRHDDAVDEPEHQRAFRLQDEAKRLNRTGLTLVALGAAVAAGGIVWGIVDLTSSDDAEVAIGLGHVAVRGRF